MSERSREQKLTDRSAEVGELDQGRIEEADHVAARFGDREGGDGDACEG